MRNLSSEARQAIFAQQTGEAFIVLLTITHPSFTDDIRLASDTLEDLPTTGGRGVVSNGLEYIYFPFNFQLPNEDDTGVARAQLQVDNVDRRITAAVRSADSALGVKIQIVLSSNPDSIELLLEDFQLQRCSYTALTVSGDLTMEYFDLEPFPAMRFTPSDFPGLY